MQKHVLSVLKIFVVVGVVTTAMAMLVYVAVQQNFRQNANDPQIQMAEDGAAVLAAGGVPASVVPHEIAANVELTQSLAPYIFVTDKQGLVLESSATQDGQVPHIPVGLFGQASARGGEYRVTWQPEPGVRQALVIEAVPNNGGYVVAGRSLREVERRSGLLGWYVIAAWASALALSFLLLVGLELIDAKIEK